MGLKSLSSRKERTHGIKIPCYTNKVRIRGLAFWYFVFLSRFGVEFVGETISRKTRTWTVRNGSGGLGRV